MVARLMVPTIPDEIWTHLEHDFGRLAAVGPVLRKFHQALGAWR
jgi:hypothetical protein